MRMSRVLLAGVAVAAAAAATSAFTAGNDFDDVPSNVAGYGQLEVTGATVTDIHYVVNGDDGDLVDAVEFTTTTNITGASSTMVLRTGATAGVGGTVVGDPSTCDVKDAWDALDPTPTVVLTCDTTATPVSFTAFNAVGLTVVS
jgi:hypothetical protein